MLQLILVGLSYKTAPVEDRERFTFPGSALHMGLEELYGKRGVEECVIVSTCNRVEIYAASEDADDCEEQIKKFLSEFHNVPVDFFSPYLYVSGGKKAAKHLFKVASGIDSMVIGEPQVLGQVKQAYRTADDRGTVGIILHRLFHSAFFTAKKVRTETDIGTRAVSVSYVAVELAKRIFEDLSKRSVMLVGAGNMAELAAKHLIGAGVTDLVVASRTLESARTLAQELNGKPIRIEEVYYSLKDSDILITATGSADFIIKSSHAREALKLRKNEPMFMIDIAVPRDIDPRVGEMQNIYLYDIDDLEAVLDENMKVRAESARKAEDIVAHVEENFMKWLHSLKVVPTIIELRNRIEEIKDAELEKALGRLRDLSGRERGIVKRLASGIVGKILHNPLTELKKEASTSRGALYVDSVKTLFDLHDKVALIEEDDEAGETSAQDRN